MRKRKRDWPLRVLKYRAYPRAIPDSLWQTARTQQRLWNDLSSCWKHTTDLAAALPARKKSFWTQFDEWAAALVKTSGLDWVNGPAVLDRLRVITRAKKAPRFHGGLRRIHLAHRFTSGGMPLGNAIDNPRLARLCLISAADWQPKRQSHSPNRTHWRGRFGIGDECIEFSMALHRPLPSNAILKAAGWLGENVGGKWFWYLALTVEEPAAAAMIGANFEKRPIAAIDLGWRKFNAAGGRRGYLRVGLLRDSQSRAIEMRLPLAIKPGRLKETRSLAAIAELQSAAGAQIQAAKQAIKAPPLIGRRGLFKRLSELDDGHRTMVKLAIDEHDRLMRRALHLQFRLRERRRWYYRNLTHWLCRRYQAIAIEDIAMPALSAKADHPALQNAARYRNYAAVAELRNALKTVAPKYGCRIIEASAVDSTVMCHLCGIKRDASPELVLQCPNGHEWDQDHNAALNLLSQITGESRQNGALLNSPSQPNWKPLEFPDTITAFAIEVPAL